MHPKIKCQRVGFEPMTDDDKLAFHMRYIAQLDPTAVYTTMGNSTVVYYESPHATNTPVNGSCRLVLAPNGDTRKIGTVGFDPR